MDSIASAAAAVRKVTSIILRPPSSSALASGLASATSSMTITGMTGNWSSDNMIENKLFCFRLLVFYFEL